MAKTIIIETPTTAVELYNLSNEFNSMRQSARKRAIATMLEGMACEHGYIIIEGKMYHFNGEKLTRVYDVNECFHCNRNTTCCTCKKKKQTNEDGECEDCASLSEIEGPITEAVTPEQLAEIMPFAQEYSEQKQMERATFAAESALETVPSYEQERQVVRIEKKSNFSMCGTSWFYSHPECYNPVAYSRDRIDVATLSHREVGSRAVCVECGGSVHEAPEQVQRQEELQHQEMKPTPQPRKKGRPSQDKKVRHYTVDREIAEFIDSLPDGERSRFVNSLLKQGMESAKKKEQ